MKQRSLWQRFLIWFKRKMREPEGGCGKCAVCHHVCGLLEAHKQKDQEGTKPDKPV